VKGSRSGEAPIALSVAMSLFALIYAILLLSDTSNFVLLNPFPEYLSESPGLVRNLVMHMLAGGTLFAAGILGIVALKRRSDRLLLVGELLGGTVLAGIVILQTMSLWTLPYLD